MLSYRTFHTEGTKNKSSRCRGLPATDRSSSLLIVMRQIILGGEGLANLASSVPRTVSVSLIWSTQALTLVDFRVRRGSRFHFATPRPSPRWYQRHRLRTRHRTADRGCRRRGAGRRHTGRVLDPGDQFLVLPSPRRASTLTRPIIQSSPSVSVPAACDPGGLARQHAHADRARTSRHVAADVFSVEGLFSLNHARRPVQPLQRRHPRVDWRARLRLVGREAVLRHDVPRPLLPGASSSPSRTSTWCGC